MSNENTLKEEGFISAGNADITYVKPKDMKVGDSVKGTLLKVIKNKFGGTDFRIETVNGIVGIGGSGHLTYKMNDVAVGSTVLITYEGTEKLTKGAFAGKQTHQFDVMYKPGPNAALANERNNNESVNDEDLTFDE